MDRTAFSACAGILLPLGAALNVGCNASARHEAPALRAEAAPLHELQAMAPGPWKRIDRVTAANAHDAEQPNVRQQQAPVELESIEPSISPSGRANEQPRAVEVVPADESASGGRTGGVPRVEAQPVQWSQPESGVRTPEVAAALAKADDRVRTGFGKAAHGAHFSARVDFLAALQLIARTGDGQQHARTRAQALDAGLTALKESDSFARLGPDATAGDVARLAAGHKTAVLKGSANPPPSPAVAAERYGAYAQEQLGRAAAGVSSGSMALFGLAKVALVMGHAETAPSPDCTRQAVILYQAAMTADPTNFCAANELGVLFAECGRLEAARDMFIRSVLISPRPATWRNLAIVHGRLGETQLARQAQARADAAGKPSVSSSVPNVQWVDAATFAQTTETTDGRPPVRPLTTDAASRAGAGPMVGIAQKKGSPDSQPTNSRR